MADGIIARDGYEAYYAEKLWALLPAIYRHEDGLAENPGVLRALIDVLAEQAAVVRRSQDRLWDDQSIELCDDWAIPYLADLVGTRLVSALNLRLSSRVNEAVGFELNTLPASGLNRRGRRVDVANTIYYRRRAGTLTVLEQLASDIAGWEGTAVESFRRLARTHHALDPAPPAGSGQHSGTPAGGSAALRRPVASELAHGAFDEFKHLVDVRRHRGRDGVYGIPKLAFHLYRLPARRLVGVTPRALAIAGGGGRTFTFDPSGRDVPLFVARERPADPAAWRRAREWELPHPIRCRLLGHAEYLLTEAIVQALPLPAGMRTALRALVSLRFPDERRFRRALDAVAPAPLTAAQVANVLAVALVDDCGKRRLLPNAVRVMEGANTVARERTVAGSLETWSATAAGRRLVVDPERGRFLFLGAAPGSMAVDYHDGFPAAIGAGSYDRRTVEAEAPDTRVPTDVADLASAATVEADGVTEIQDSRTYTPIADKSGIVATTIQAASAQRPFLALATNWVLDTGARTDSRLMLEGLWVGGGREVRLRGDYERVVVAHSTLDPGGHDAAGSAIAPTGLVVEGQVEELLIAASILGPIGVSGAGVVERVVVEDSIVGSFDLPRAELDLARVTVLGPLAALRLAATETLVTGLGDVTDTQAGCFRFSAAPPGSRVPRRHRSHELVEHRALFVSRRFGDPGYAQVSGAAPESIRRGAENGSEIGAFSAALMPVKADGLGAKVDEYIPFGLVPLYVMET